MSYLNTIRRQSASVMEDSPSGINETWMARILDSQASLITRTYLPWFEIQGLKTQEMDTEIFDPERQVYKHFRTASFRVSENAPVLNQGDQVQDPSTGDVWAVMGIKSKGPGTVAYQISRDIALLSGPDRKGMV